jgi:hypothetical protein
MNYIIGGSIPLVVAIWPSTSTNYLDSLSVRLLDSQGDDDGLVHALGIDDRDFCDWA